MTLCIAAVCDDLEGTDPKIVLCSDFQKETEGIGSSETEDKLGFVRSGWPALQAGNIAKSNELTTVYAGYLSENFDKINEFNILDHMRMPPHAQKDKLVDHYLQQTFSFSRSYFYGEGKTKLPEDFVRQQQDIISRIKLEASLIIAGFIPETDFAENRQDNRPFICVVDDARGTEEVSLEYEYGAIGSGCYPALSNLYRREQDSVNPLAQTLYNVYEANVLSDKVPGVGKEFIKINILYSDGTLKTFTNDGYNYLRKRFLKYGPQPIKAGKIEFKDDFVEPFTTDKSKPSEAQAI